MPGRLTDAQLDAGCRERFVQDFHTERGYAPPSDVTWDSVRTEHEKRGDRKDILQIIRAVESGGIGAPR